MQARRDFSRQLNAPTAATISPKSSRSAADTGGKARYLTIYPLLLISPSGTNRPLGVCGQQQGEKVHLVPYPSEIKC
jgi:hypothetical protein